MVCLWQPREEALSSRHNLGAAGVRHLSSLEVRPRQTVNSQTAWFRPVGGKPFGCPAMGSVHLRTA